jgi:RNA polymerase sigma-70 factor (ECF subfamily)
VARCVTAPTSLNSFKLGGSCPLEGSFTRVLGFLVPVRRSGVEDAATVLPGTRPANTSGGASLTVDELCRLYAGRINKFAQLISRDAADAEDLAQDALERAIKGLKTFDPARGELEGWLWRIVVNAARDTGRIARRQRLVVDLLADRLVANERVIQFGSELRTDEVLNAVRTLSPRYRAVVALRFGTDLSYRGVGQALGISEAAALMATRRALMILRHRLSQGVHQ